MKTTTSQKTRIGIFTVLGLLLLVAGVYIIGKKKNLFGNTFHIYGTFNNVGGLREGNNIRLAGINVGTVEEIFFVSDSEIRVNMVLQSKIKPYLKTTSIASIGSDGLMGDKLLVITSGDATSSLLPKGGKILTVNPVDFDTKITAVANNAQVISTELAAITVQIREGKGSLGRLLTNDDLARSLEGTSNNAQKITASLADITSNIKNGNGSVGRLLYTDNLAKSLEGTAASANVTMGTINDAAYGFSENMKALQNNFLFKGYFKKQAKAKEKALLENGNVTLADSTDVDLDEAELLEIEAAAEKAHQVILERKKRQKEN